ncbi:MAG: winged helix DNA-binding domain-containing protein [Propionibacteriaceae bacterium]|nr:winged helix DNA-binding domain-containing protein [Propionibacteriaceae bacterium]
MSDHDRLSLAQARRLALAAQGLARPRPTTVGSRQLSAVMDRIALLQIDSVNVVERAHLVPLYSRLGPYPRQLVADAASLAPRRLLETWAHEASLVRVDVYHLMAWRRAEPERYAWGQMKAVQRDRPDLVRQVLALLAEAGPLGARSVQNRLGPQRRRGDGWGWNWSESKAALEWLFLIGQVAVAGRAPNFERLYDLAERVAPPPPPGLPQDRAGQLRALTELAARAHGVASPHCLADYFRMPLAETRRAIAELVEDQVLVPVRVEGWPVPLYRHLGVRGSGPIERSALLVAFDPLIFNRRRLEALFGMRFRLEYYLPPERRVHGYYVMPFLWGDQLVARVDLKADRGSGQLALRGAWTEPAQPVGAVAEALAEELGRLAVWLGLERVVVAEEAAGDLATQLRSARL